MLLANIILAAGVWIFLTAEVWCSKWIKRTGRYSTVMVMLTSFISGIVGVRISLRIAEMKRQQTLQATMPVSPASERDERKRETIADSKQAPKASAKTRKAPAPIVPANSAPWKPPYDLAFPGRPKQLADLLKTNWLPDSSGKVVAKTADAPRDTIRIGCASWRKYACVAAGNFLIVFSEAGWQIDAKRVYRLDPQIPTSGVALVSPFDNSPETMEEAKVKASLSLSSRYLAHNESFGT